MFGANHKAVQKTYNRAMSNLVKGIFMKKQNLKNTLKSRGSKYGNFTENAEIAQDLKDRMRASGNWDSLPPAFREGLDIVQLKVSRILTAKADFNNPDNLHDIQGYAKLLEDRCK